MVRFKIGEASILVFEPVNVVSAGEHVYACYDLSGGPELITELAKVVQDLYVEREALLEQLRAAAQGLEDVCDERELARAVDQVTRAVVPQMNFDSKQPIHLQVPRNEVAEVIALHVLTEIHEYSVPASRIRNKEVSGLPSRGLDVLGITDKSAVVLTEVKASSSQTSPPAVVHSTTDSMHGETLRRLNSPDSLIAELNWALKHAKPDMQMSVARSLLLHARDMAPTPTVAPVLVRPAGTYQDSDFGNFQNPVPEFGDSPIRFVVVRLPGTLEEFADEVYAKARESMS